MTSASPRGHQWYSHRKELEACRLTPSMFTSGSVCAPGALSVAFHRRSSASTGPHHRQAAKYERATMAASAPRCSTGTAQFLGVTPAYFFEGLDRRGPRRLHRRAAHHPHLSKGECQAVGVFLSPASGSVPGQPGAVVRRGKSKPICARLPRIIEYRRSLTDAG